MRLIEQFEYTYVSDNVRSFVSVGNDLTFEFQFMKHKLKQCWGLEDLRLGHRPVIDVRHVLVIVNNGSFIGCPRSFGKVRISAQYGITEHSRMQD